MSSTKDIATRSAEIVDEFSLFDDPMDRYDYLIDLGKELSEMPEVYRVEHNLVKGCQSKVWLHATSEQGKVLFYADSNTVITKGIIALLVRVLSDQRPEDIVSAKLDFIDEIDLRSHLSSQRSNGLTAMIDKMKEHAARYAAKPPDAMTAESADNNLRESIIAAIKTVFDPEIPVDIWELGLIYEIRIADARETTADRDVEIIMTLTSPLCPVAGSMPFEVKEKVAAVDGVGEAEIEMTYDPPWNKDMMSDEARVELDMF